MTKDEAAERQQLAAAQAGRDARAAAKRLEVRQFKAEIAARLQMAEEADVYDDELDAASNAVVDLVKAGKLDEAKAAAPRPDNSESPHVVGSRAISVLRTGASPETRGTAQKNAASQSGFMDQSVRSSRQLYPTYVFPHDAPARRADAGTYPRQRHPPEKPGSAPSSTGSRSTAMPCAFSAGKMFWSMRLRAADSSRRVFAHMFRNGAPGRIRTYDLRLRRATLYPAELRVHAGR